MAEKEQERPTRRKAAGSGGGKREGATGRKRGGADAANGGNTPEQPAKSGRGGARPASGKSQDLRRDLRDFASGRPQGWGHDDWITFLETLKSRGHNVHDTDAIGAALEKERLDLALSGIRGMGPQRRQALVERFETVWSVRNAEVEEIASTAKIPRPLAEQVKSEL